MGTIDLHHFKIYIQILDDNALSQLSRCLASFIWLGTAVRFIFNFKLNRNQRIFILKVNETFNNLSFDLKFVIYVSFESSIIST